MDPTRRWQLVSVATAIAGLGVGSLLLGRPPSTAIAPIDLDLVVASTAPADDGSEGPPLDGWEIVPPVIREDQVEIPDSHDPADDDRDTTDPGRSSSSPDDPPPAPTPAPRPPDLDDDQTDETDERDETDETDETDERDEEDEEEEEEEAEGDDDEDD